MTRVRFAVADSSGRIKWWGRCAPEDLEAQTEAQAALGHTTHDVSHITDWTGKGEDYHFDGTAVVARAHGGA